MLIKHNWTIHELRDLHEKPLLKLIAKALETHEKFHILGEMQVCHLISIKTGGCPEDCKYCSQSARYQTSVKAQPIMKFEEVLKRAKKAIAQGATRVCLGAAWKGVRNNRQFEEVLNMIKSISELGVEVCCTLGHLNDDQAQKLKEAGLYAYNHNLDSSERFYKTIISTRSYQDRLDTLDIAKKNKISICCGGIIGMGESIQDRLELFLTLANRAQHPESVPINQFCPIPGTPLENQPKPSFWELIRMVAIARITMPKAIVRLSAGRINLSYQEQALCFLAGANSIFAGDKLLTIKNTSIASDEEMFKLLGLKKRISYAQR